MAVAGVSFSVDPGRSLAIVGQSGSGKSTCARIIAGIERQTSGSVELDGELAVPAPRSRRERKARAQHVQMVFQDPYSSLDPRQSVRDAVRRSSQNTDRRRPHCVGSAHGSYWTRWVSTNGSAWPNPVSAVRRSATTGGDRKGTRCPPEGSSSSTRPSPPSTSACKPKSFNSCPSFVREEGLTYLFVSHDLGVVRQVSDECVVMHRGQGRRNGRDTGGSRQSRRPTTPAR